MAKPKLSHKDLRKTSHKQKEVFYPAAQTDYGKNKTENPEQKRLSYSKGIRILW